jgi:hypothetical protein
VVFVHIPYFVACAAIVHARGFAPTDYLTVLFGKQLTLLSVTLPAIALATLVVNLTQFMIVAIVLATAVAAPMASPYFRDLAAAREIREFLVCSITTTAALWIAIAQYGRRRTSAARVAGIAAIAAAAVVWWLPQEQIESFEPVWSPAAAAAGHLSIHLTGPDDPHPVRQGFDLAGGPDAIRVAVPVTVSGAAPGYFVRIRLAGFRLREPGGQQYDAIRNATRLLIGPLTASLHGYPGDIPTWQLLTIDRKIFDRIGNLPVNLSGSAYVDYYRLSGPSSISLDERTAVAGLGNCSAVIVGNSPNEQLRVGCESPRTLPFVLVRLVDPSTNREWNHRLGDATMILDHPANPWLTPVDRLTTFFTFTDEEHYDTLYGRSQVPRDVMPTARISITPEIAEGTALIDYDIPNIRLNQYVVKP